MKFLDNLKILDASHVIAGPYATYQLALMGADVIRVERIVGDDFVRAHGGTDQMKADGLGASFISQNATKRCIQIDLKHPKGVELFKRLAKETDVVMENYRPGVMDRLGIGFDAIKAVNPDVIYCSLSGFGSDGPLRDAPAYDHIVQGMSGLMSMTGTLMTGPLRVGLPITDYIAGTHAAMAILAALNRRAQTGEGGHIEVSMLAAVLSGMGAYGVDTQTTGTVRGLEGNRPFSGSPFAGSFKTADGDLVITANTLPQAERLVAELGSSDLAPFIDGMRDGRTFTEYDIQTAEGALALALSKDTAENWEVRFAAISVPAGKVRTLDEVLAHPQIDAIGCTDAIDLAPYADTVKVPGLAFKDTRDKSPNSLPMPEPRGHSTRAALKELGLEDEEINVLACEKVIAGADLPG